MIIADSQTVTSNEFIKVIYEGIKSNGRIISLFDLMNVLKSQGDGEEEVRKYFNTGTHLTQAHLKTKEQAGT